ncbi:uncharacterized protein ACBT44_014692 isoform 2-T2 [Syngnathus typhle]
MPRKGKRSRAVKLQHQRRRMLAQQEAETSEPVILSSTTEDTDAPLPSSAKETSGQTLKCPSSTSVEPSRKRLKSDILSSSARSDSTRSWLPVIIDVFSVSDPKRGLLLSKPIPTTNNEETNDDLVIQGSPISH